MKTPYLITNAQLVLENSVETGWLMVLDGKISNIGFGKYNGESDGDVLDAKGNYLSPGFIDLHVHGGNGCDFMDADPEGFEKIARYHSSNGVTSMLATTLAGEADETESVLKTFCRVRDSVECCNLLGVHLEGPYFSHKYKGAQDPRYLKNPDTNEAERLLSYGVVKRWSMAPELEGAKELAKELKKAGIVASVAHTDADFDTVKSASDWGFSLMTHLYSGMSQASIRNGKRVGGAVEAGLLLDEMTVELIADGYHLGEEILRLILKCKGYEKIILTSDAMRGAGLPENSVTKLGSLKNGQDVRIYDGVAHTMDGTAFAGSVASGNRLLKTMLSATGLPVWAVVSMVTKNPAKLIGVDDRKGLLKVGMDADLVLFDKDINVISVMNSGKWI